MRIYIYSNILKNGIILDMYKRIFLTAVGIVFVACGCLAPKNPDWEKINIESMRFYRAGILEFSGSYDDGSWGLTGVRGKIDGDAVVLEAMAEFWGGEDTFAHRIAVPKRINEVRFGKKVIWNREKEKVALPAEKIPVKKVPEKKVPEKKVPEIPSEDEELPDVEPDDPDKKDENSVPEKSCTALKIGGAGTYAINVEWLSFEKIFWGVPQKKANDRFEVMPLEQGSAAVINRYKDLEVLEIKGRPYEKIDLTGLALPKLKKLVIDNGEVAGLHTAELPALEEFYLNDTRTVPLEKVSLPPALPRLHSVGVQAFAGNFNFDSLAGKPVRKLSIHGDCRSFGFLKNLPLEELKFSGFTARKEDLDLLRALPLKKLKLHPLRPLADWSFLSGMKLNSLDITCSSGSNFSPELLENMPLEVLRIMVSLPVNWDPAWEKCRNLPLKELILRNAAVPEKFLTGSKLERLALFNCAWHTEDPFVMLNSMTALKHLAVWRMVQYRNNRIVQRMDFRLDWKKLTGSRLESLCISSGDINFLQQLPAVKKFALRECGKVRVKMDGLRDRNFEILNLPPLLDGYHPSVTGVRGTDNFTAGW